jgi:predicted dienelactone hydrolase
MRWDATASSRRRAGRRAPVVVVTTVLTALAALAALAACSGASGGSGSQSSAPPGSTTPSAADDAAYTGPGPYVAGTTTLDLGGRKVEVWYPADPGAEAGKTKAVFEIRDLLPDQLKSLVPDALNPKYETDAYRDITASTKGPFPLVLFSHGFAGYPTEYQYLLTHLAQWGFVVAAPDFYERGLIAAFTGSAASGDDTTVLQQTIQLLTDQSNAAGTVLTHTVDATRIGAVGHSAGVGSTLGIAAANPNVKTFVAMSGGLFDSGGPNATTTAGGTGSTLPPTKVPTQPGMVMTGGKDNVAAFDTVQHLYDAMTPPKRLVVVKDAGHNSFDDLCVIGADQGGLLQIAQKVGIKPTDQIVRLFDDGCTDQYLAAQQVWPVARHFVTAQLRAELGVDPTPVGLGPGVVDHFAPVAVDYQHQP